MNLLLSFWALGTVVALVSTGRDMRRMKRLIRSGEPATPGLQLQVKNLARRLGLTRAPQVHLIPGKLSPMLWAAGGEPKLLLPQELLPRLEPRARPAPGCQP